MDKMHMYRELTKFDHRDAQDGYLGEDAAKRARDLTYTEWKKETEASYDLGKMKQLIDNWVGAMADMNPKLCPDAWATCKRKVTQVHDLYVRLIKENESIQPRV
jgi:hypothetical protein